MTVIEINFLARRYHGTAWGRHVNEGAAEWPPSPYRLLRAMYDAWRRKYAEVPETQIQSVFEALARNPPRFWLPPAVSAHTRSYLSSNTESQSDKSLIFDAFVSLSDPALCYVAWDVELSTEQRRTLASLLGGLNYLGRSESWIEARLFGGEPNGIPCLPAEYAAATANLAYVACPKAPARFAGNDKWLDALTYSTTRILKEKLSGPPAMEYVPYALPKEAVTTWLPQHMARRERQVSAAVLQLNGRVLPMITDSVRVAERVRGRLMRYFEQNRKPIPPMVHGKDASGTPLKTRHTHLFILPRSNKLGRIDHVLIYTASPSGFEAGVEDAIASVRRLVWGEEMRVVPAWLGRADDSQIRRRTLVVKSSTPFVTVRHWREGRGLLTDFLAREIERECENHGLKSPIKIEEIKDYLDCSRFRRAREGDPSRKGYAYRLVFDEDVLAPFSLGYGCHFGLGQFEAE